MKKIFFVFLVYCVPPTVYCLSQGIWTKKSTLDNAMGREGAVAFSIGTKGYVGTGSPTAASPSAPFGVSFWEWDQPTDTWTQKADYGGLPRFFATGCSIGNKGYIGTGLGVDWWEYDPVANGWTKKADFPLALNSAVAFTIGAKGYVGTGSTNGGSQNFWEYDPATDTWTSIANYLGLGRRYAVAFTIGAKGYVGTGSTLSGLKKDFWEYDPAANAWTQIASLPKIFTPVDGIYEATAFNIGKFGYVGTGTTQAGTGCFSDFWKYDPAINTWTPIANFGGGIREMASGFSIGCYGYVVGGYINDAGIGFTDLWEYHDSTNTTCGCSIAASINGSTTICSGQSITLTASGGTNYSWNTGNTTSSIIVLPTTSSNYSVVVSSSPSCSNTASVTVTVAPPPTASVSGNQNICQGQSATLSASGGANYSWSNGATTSVINISPTTTTNYTVTVSNGTSCSSSISAMVTVSPVSSPVISGNTILCVGDTATLTASGGGAYLWNTGATTSSITAAAIATATYTVVSSNANGCTAAATATVSVSPTPVASVSPVTICSGQNATLTASGGGTYIWNTGNTTPSVSVSPSINTTYSVLVSIGTCTAAVSAAVTVSPSPSLSILGNISLCAGDIATLTASGGGANYLWNTGATTSSITAAATATATYTVVSSNTNGCTAAAAATVSVSQPPVASATSATICTGQTAILTASGGSNYSWSNGATTQSITAAGAATYSVIVSIGSCSDTASAPVIVNPNPSASAASNVTITQGQSTTLSASGGGNYSWSNGGNTSAVTVAPAVTTIYCVVVTNSFGCSDSACVTVVVESVEPIDCSFAGELFVPNAFSPNNDGDNDVLQLYYGNLQCIKKIKIIIYNRWGEKVYETTDSNFQWDGTFRGETEESAVFTYYMKADLVNGGEISRKGNVSLMR